MFDIWWGKIELTTLVLIFSVIVLLPIQLLVCFKSKNRIIRLLPLILFLIPAIVFGGMAIVATGWDSAVYVILAIFALFMVFMCGVGWSIWGLGQFIKKKKNYTLEKH